MRVVDHALTVVVRALLAIRGSFAGGGAAGVRARVGADDRAVQGSAVELESVVRVFGRGRGAVRALDGVSLRLSPSSFTAVMGPSGSGKTTLLLCAAGLERPDCGSVRLGGVDLDVLSEAGRARLRREHVGFVFQSFNLLDALTAAQNVTLPLRLARKRCPRARVHEALARVGLEDKARQRPPELSGGEQQRVAVARALIGKPDVVFADEPTGALDLASGRAVLEALRGAVDELGQTVLMVTHDPRSAARADRVVFLADGRVVGEAREPTAELVADRLAALEG